MPGYLIQGEYSLPHLEFRMGSGLLKTGDKVSVTVSEGSDNSVVIHVGGCCDSS